MAAHINHVLYFLFIDVTILGSPAIHWVVRETSAEDASLLLLWQPLFQIHRFFKSCYLFKLVSQVNNHIISKCFHLVIHLIILFLYL